MDILRDLLLAALALRANLISPDQFAQACQRWRPGPASPLLDLLLERGWLTSADRPHLDYLLERNLQKHGSQRAVLMALADATLRPSLADVRNPELQRWLTDVLPGPLWTEPPEMRKRTLSVVTVLLALVIGLVSVGGLVTLLGGSFLLTRQRVAVEQARAEAAEQEARALMQRQRAEANLDIARQAVDENLTQRADQELAGQPQQEALRQKLLEEALQTHLQLLQEKGTDPQVRSEAARAYQRVAESYRKAKKEKEAEEAYRKAIELQLKLVAEYPDVADYGRDLANSIHDLIELLQATNRPEEAAKALQAGKELEKPLVKPKE